MPERSGYAAGLPCWVDIGTDVDGAKRFYGDLFGWSAVDAGPPEETGGYGFFTKNGLLVAGFGPQQNPGPPFWSTYVATADADATAKKVEKAGGTVVVAPMDVMTAGRMAVFQDAGGAFFSVWQAGEHKGAQVVNEHGALCWNELQTRDVDGAKSFYRAAFGWDTETHTDTPMQYTEFKIDGTSIAGMMAMPPNVPAQVPPYWLAYFAVDDADATVARASELGGDVLVVPMDIAVGRFAVLADPQGASFGIIKLAETPAG
jgi:uncharacterized protein